MVDQATKTVAGSLAQLKAFVRPANATPTAAGLMTAADKEKLTGLPANATANQPDAYLLDRANHTGAQNIGTISGLQAALDSKLESVNVAGVTGLQAALDSKLESVNVAGVTGLQSALDAKLESVNVAGVTGLQSALDAKADAADLADTNDAVAGLETGMAGKLDKNNPEPTGAFKFPSYTFAGKPAAASNAGRYIEITGTVDGTVIARSNGTGWVKVAVVSADVVAAP
jgi:hypothetical protein